MSANPLLWYLLCLCVLSHAVTGARILGVLPTCEVSHHLTGSALLKGLAARGHEVTVISGFPQNPPLPHYRDIYVPEVFNNTVFNALVGTSDNMNRFDLTSAMIKLYEAGMTTCRLFLESPTIKEFLSSDKEQFDLVIMEVFLTESLFGFGTHFNAPIIAFSSFGTTSWHNELVGSPEALSYVPVAILPFSGHMKYWQRLANVGFYLYERIMHHLYYMPKQRELYNKHFDSATHASLDHMLRNFSLVILNQHFSLSSPRPYTPNVIEAGGMHLKREVTPLPKEIQEFLDGATEGAIYFSLGSLFKSKNLPPNKLRVILNTFASLKQRVVWKFENSSIPGLPSNVLIKPWLPQPDILAHPNVRLFITHGGLLSTMETIYHGKPILGIPLFGDQPMNMAHAERAGIGLRLNYQELEQASFQATIEELLNNSSYTRRVQEMSAQYRDQPLTPLETAVFWTEYVLRHKGAPQLQVAGMDLNYWQFNSFDTIATVIGIVLLLVMIPILIIKGIWTLLKRLGSRNIKQKVQ